MNPTPKPAGVDVQVNINTAGNKLQPCVTSLSDGGFVLTWQSRGQNGSGWGINARRYDSNGVEVGKQFQVDTSTFECEGPASVTALSDGGFIVAWPSGGGLSSRSQVYGQRFGSDGAAVGSASRINSDATGNHFYVAVSGFSDGGYLATWTSDSEDGLFNVYGQRYRADGTAIGVEFRINTYPRAFRRLALRRTVQRSADVRWYGRPGNRPWSWIGGTEG